jgi:hypothetical protein
MIFRRRGCLYTPVGLRPPCVPRQPRRITTGSDATYHTPIPVQTIPATAKAPELAARWWLPEATVTAAMGDYYDVAFRRFVSGENEKFK